MNESWHSHDVNESKHSPSVCVGSSNDFADLFATEPFCVGQNGRSLLEMG